MDRGDELVQFAERRLLDAETANRADPSERNRRRVMAAWSEVREARGEPADGRLPWPLLAPRHFDG